MPALSVAVVGAGAAGMYAVQHLLEQLEYDVAVDLIERLPTPWGLVRSGVAPDHPEKKQIVDRLFQLVLGNDRVRLLGNVRVGIDISHEELSARYHAVIYAIGADDDRALGIPGEHLPGSWSARQFVAWYNGHPDHRDLAFDLSVTRAVIVGTGNVALDVARILTLPIADLERTDIAAHALDALRKSRIRDVDVLGRRGCQQAAFHNPELEELLHLKGVEVRVYADDLSADAQASRDWATRRKLATLARLQAPRLAATDRRITFRFHHVPRALTGKDRVAGVEVEVSGEQAASRILPCGLVLRAIGYRGRALEGLPFDPARGVIDNVEGRVVADGRPLAGCYTTGWIKRGPRGVLGSNKRCAAETVTCLLTDALAGRLTIREPGGIAPLLAERGCQVVTKAGWQRIDDNERRAGRIARCPRVKLTAHDELLAVAGTRDDVERPASTSSVDIRGRS